MPCHAKFYTSDRILSYDTSRRQGCLHRITHLKEARVMFYSTNLHFLEFVDILLITKPSPANLCTYDLMEQLQQTFFLQPCYLSNILQLQYTFHPSRKIQSEYC